MAPTADDAVLEGIEESPDGGAAMAEAHLLGLPDRDRDEILDRAAAQTARRLHAAALALLTARVEKRGAGAVTEHRSRKQRDTHWLRGPWPLAAGAIGLALVLGASTGRAEPKTGTMIDQGTADEIKDQVPPEIYQHYKKGEYINPIVDFPSTRWDWDDEFKECIRFCDELHKLEWSSLMVVYNGGGTVRKEIQHWAALGKKEPGRWNVLLIKGSGRVADEFANDEVIQSALGAHVCEWFMEAKRGEWNDYRIRVTPWELERYLMTY